MNVSHWHRNTSLLALSLSIDSALRIDRGRGQPICDSYAEDEGSEKHRAQCGESKSRAAVAISASTRRERVAGN